MFNNLEDIIIDSGNEILKFKLENSITSHKINNHVKTNIDNYADQIIKEKLNKLLRIPIISEESFKKKNVRPDEYFIIDPIDGTLSLLNGYKTWVTQLAYINKNKLIYSAIFEPEADNLYSASISDGVFFNKKKFSNKEIKDSNITFIDNYPHPNKLNQRFMSFFKNTSYIECGSLSLKICKIILNEANVFVKEVPVRDWDIAPPLLLANMSNIDVFDYNFNRYKIIGSFEKKGLIVCNKILTETIKKNK